MRGFINGALSFLMGAIGLSLFSTMQKMISGYPIVLKGYLVPILIGGTFGLIIGVRRLKSKKNKKKMERLNLVLRTIRSVNQLIVKESDRTKLIQGVCDNLIENRGYYNAWIALLDEHGRLVESAEAGLGDEFIQMIEQLKSGELTQCAQKALAQSGVVIIEDPFSACTDCALSEKYAGRGAMTVYLEKSGKGYGLLTVSIPVEFTVDEEERGLFQEIAWDIAFGLYRIELEEDHRRAEEALRKRTYDLGERVKELNCLYAISKLFEKRGISFEEILQGTVDIIPSAWQYPEITCARIIFKDQEFKTSNFKETIWKQTGNINVHDKPTGILEVCYLEERPAIDEGPFLKEERNLINSIAERLGKVTERIHATDALQESEKRFRTLVENSLTGISIIQDNQIVYQNSEQEKLLGPLPRTAIIADIESIHSDDVEKVKKFHQQVITGDIQTTDIDFRFYPLGEKDRRTGMKWVYCRTSAMEYRGKDAILVNIIDMTKAKELEHFLRIQDKMSSLGRVAVGIAHEIRNPLSGINIYLNTLEKIYDKTESLDKVEQILNQLKSASKKIGSVIRRVMDFSKPSEPRLILTDLSKPIEAAISLSSVTLRKSGVKIEKELDENIPECRLDPHLIEEVILNLIHNAADAMRNIDSEKIIRISSSMTNNIICVTISDSGLGVPLEMKDKIFDPFYTTKNGSTGIGLSLSHRIITDHGGSLDVSKSNLGGAKFILKIPKEK